MHQLLPHATISTMNLFSSHTDRRASGEGASGEESGFHRTRVRSLCRGCCRRGAIRHLTAFLTFGTGGFACGHSGEPSPCALYCEAALASNNATCDPGNINWAVRDGGEPLSRSDCVKACSTPGFAREEAIGLGCAMEIDAWNMCFTATEIDCNSTTLTECVAEAESVMYCVEGLGH